MRTVAVDVLSKQQQPVTTEEEEKQKLSILYSVFWFRFHIYSFDINVLTDANKFGKLIHGGQNLSLYQAAKTCIFGGSEGTAVLALPHRFLLLLLLLAA